MSRRSVPPVRSALRLLSERINRVLTPQSFMSLRYTRVDENGASALITLGADQQNFKTTDYTYYARIITEWIWTTAQHRGLWSLTSWEAW